MSVFNLYSNIYRCFSRFLLQENEEEVVQEWPSIDYNQRKLYCWWFKNCLNDNNLLYLRIEKQWKQVPARAYRRGLLKEETKI